MSERDLVTVALRLPFEGHREFSICGGSRDESLPSTIRRLGGYYEPEVMRVLHRVLAQDAICLDIGANLGAIALAMSSLAPQGRVYAFEPIPENFALLQRNVADNGVTNVEPIHAGVFSTPKTLEFHYVEEFAAGSFLSPLGVSDHRERRIEVPCTTVDAFARDRALTRVDFMKIDVEGAEQDVIEGARRVCTAQAPLMVIEFNPVVSEKFFGRSLEGLHDSLRGLGYDLHIIQRWTASGLWTVPSYAALMERIGSQGGVGDVLCLPRGRSLPPDS